MPALPTNTKPLLERLGLGSEAGWGFSPGRLPKVKNNYEILPSENVKKTFTFSRVPTMVALGGCHRGSRPEDPQWLQPLAAAAEGTGHTDFSSARALPAGGPCSGGQRVGALDQRQPQQGPPCRPPRRDDLSLESPAAATARPPGTRLACSSHRSSRFLCE